MKQNFHLRSSFIGLDRLLISRCIDGFLFAMQVSAGAATLFYCLVHQQEDWSAAILSSLFLVMLTGVRGTLLTLTTARGHKQVYDAGLRLRETILDHLMKLPYGIFQALNPGRLGQAFGQDMLWLENDASNTKPDLYFNATAMFFILVPILFINPMIAMTAIAFMGAGFFLLVFASKKLAKGLGLRAKSLENASHSITEFCQGIAVLRNFGSQEEAIPDFYKQVDRLRTGARKGILFATPLGVAFRACVDCASVLSIVLAIYLTIQQDHISNTDIGDLAAICLFLGAMSIPARNFAAFLAMMTLARLAEKNISSILAEAELVPGNQKELPLQTPVSFENVCFSYPAHTQKSLDNVSFEAEYGKITALVGLNGSGKTTCLHLLMRFFDVSQGRITVNGINLRDFTDESLSTLFAPIFQEPRLFHDTIIENIRIGRPGASYDEVVSAAKAAAIHDVIMARADGYDTIVSPFGNDFSGGERQRISIARAMLKDAPIVLLDEATSALDPENEYLIQTAIQALVQNKTVIVIAHRLSTIIDADHIVVLKDASVAASGTHQHLIQISPHYKSLWDNFQNQTFQDL